MLRHRRPREREEGISYSEAVKNNKWSTREINAAKIQQEGKKLLITNTAGLTQNDTLEEV